MSVYRIDRPRIRECLGGVVRLHLPDDQQPGTVVTIFADDGFACFPVAARGKQWVRLGPAWSGAAETLRPRPPKAEEVRP